MEAAPTVVLPGRLLGPSLTVAGLAARILSFAGRDAESRRTRDLQDLVDAGLRSGETDVEIVRPVVEEAVSLWLTAADLADAWALEARAEEPAEADRRIEEFGRMSARLRVRAGSLQRVLDRAERRQP
ncbi:MAG: hypothetical protein JWR42_233 [Marmoricola sp.]|nr:hypothetical protein [Marmoricola sp.]